MKKVMLTLTLFVISILLISCGGKVDDESTISFSWWGTSDRNIATYEAIELFEEKYPQYTVIPSQSAWGGYQQTLNNQLNRGTEADVFQINYNWIYSMYGDDFFMDLNDLDIDFSDYPENEHAPLTVNDKILGLSVSETGYIFYLNKTVYDAAEIDIDEIKTWGDLMNAGLAIKDASPGSYALGRMDRQSIAMLMWTYLAQLTGKNLINDENQLNFSHAELVDAFNFINDLRDTGVLIPSNATDTHNDGPTNPNWTAQRYGGLMTWNTAISEYQNTLPNRGENLVAAGMFQLNESEEENFGMYKKVSMAYAVSKRVAESDAKKDAVRTFLEFMTTDPEAVEILGVDRGVSNHPETQSVLTTSTIKDFTQTLEWQGHAIVQNYYNTQIENNINLYIHPYYEHATFRAIYESPIERFLLKTMTANEAATQIINRFNNELAKVIGD